MKRFVGIGLGLLGAVLVARGCGGSDNGVNGSQDGGAEAGFGDDDSGTSVCGNGTVEGREACDLGAQNGTGAGCNRDCTFTCVPGDPTRGDTTCDDANACNGKETCGANHACTPGTPLGNGSSCGNGKLCNAGACTDSVCGDGIVTAPEECDDGNAANGDGCESTCKFTCVSTDATRNCAPADSCQGKGTCDDALHKCTPGTPLGDGTGCGAGGADGGAPTGVCKGGTCVNAQCGDGVIEGTEDCDFGAGNAAGSGCELNCKFSCTKSPESCTTTDTCAGTNACTTVTVSGHAGQKCVTGTPPAPGTTCGVGGSCQGGVCITANCGNGTLDTNEDCDFGKGNNLAGSGCEPDCKFSCTTKPNSCPGADQCTASPQACSVIKGANNTNGQKCTPATQLAQCAACATGGVCVSKKCASSTCGDGCVDGAKNETCEPPNTATCDANCHAIVCGNGTLEGKEQCDDGNKLNLDGCDSTCQFEQVQRANSVTIQYATDPNICPKNALGTAITGLAQGSLSNSLSQSVYAGTTSIELKFMGITDLSGTSQASGLQLGALTGVPVANPAKTYDGGADLDWWYTTPTSVTPPVIDGNRNPTSLMPATIAATALNAKGSIEITISIAGQQSHLHLSTTTITAHVGKTLPPTVSTGTTPGHLEHIASTVTSFASMNSGTLCGNISAASLAGVPAPAQLLAGGSTVCAAPFAPPTYTTANSLLDVLVGGCVLGVLPVISATQPDTVDPAMPAVGGGPAYILAADPTSKKVTSCHGADNKVLTGADLQTCLNAAAYSSYFTFTSDRIIAK